MIIELILLGVMAVWLVSVTIMVNKNNIHTKEIEETIEERHNHNKETTFDYVVECKQLNQTVSKLSHQVESLQEDKRVLQNQILELKNEVDNIKYEIKNPQSII